MMTSIQIDGYYNIHQSIHQATWPVWLEYIQTRKCGAKKCFSSLLHPGPGTHCNQRHLLTFQLKTIDRTDLGHLNEKPPTTDLPLEHAREARDLRLLKMKTTMTVLNLDSTSSRSVTLGRSWTKWTQLLRKGAQAELTWPTTTVMNRATCSMGPLTRWHNIFYKRTITESPNPTTNIILQTNWLRTHKS